MTKSTEQAPVIQDAMTARFGYSHPHPEWCNTPHDQHPDGYFHAYTAKSASGMMPIGVTVQVQSFVSPSGDSDREPYIEVSDFANKTGSVCTLEWDDPAHVAAIASALLDASDKLRSIQSEAGR